MGSPDSLSLNGIGFFQSVSPGASWDHARELRGMNDARSKVVDNVSEFITKCDQMQLLAACKSFCCESLRTGAADLPRIGDLQLDADTKHFKNRIVESVIESVRAAIQTGFYTCDYTTKPNATCAPLLHHLAGGMKALEQQMQNEASAANVEALAASGALHGTGASATVTKVSFSSARVLSAEENQARRRLIRLWTAANQAIAKGLCLQVIVLLTRREVIRTHTYWKVMMKRAIWALHEALRFDETTLQEQPPEIDLRLDCVQLGSDDEMDTPDVDLAAAAEVPSSNLYNNHSS